MHAVTSSGILYDNPYIKLKHRIWTEIKNPRVCVVSVSCDITKNKNELDLSLNKKCTRSNGERLRKKEVSAWFRRNNYSQIINNLDKKLKNTFTAPKIEKIQEFRLTTGGNCE